MTRRVRLLPADKHGEDSGTGRLSHLPLAGLTEEKFEEFCTELVGMLPEYTNVHRHGRPGDKQEGIDAVADHGEKHLAFQYRRVTQYGPNAFARTVSDVTYEAAAYVIVIARRASSLTRQAVRRKRKWTLWDQEDLSLKVRSLPEAKAWRLLGQYFEPSVRSRFLGRQGPATFRDLDDHFQPTMEEGRLFDHRAPLVGREEVLENLQGFLDDRRSLIAVLPGRGGLGKTRILKAFGETSRGEAWTVLFAAENAAFDKAALDEIPLEPCLLFIDDAHRSPDLANLVSHLSRRREPTKLVLSIRPEARSGLLGQLGSAGVDVRAVISLPELDELDDEQGRALAQAILGEELAHLAPALYLATRDCTLVTVVAARLLRERQLSPALLAEDQEFRDGVLERFRQQMLAQVGDTMPTELKGKLPRIVDVLSAVQPFGLEEEELVNLAARHVGVSPSDFVRAVDELKKAGLLIRRGYQVRIVPDVLGDFILGSACLTSTGIATGFAKEIVDRFSGVAFDRLLANLSELDWRVRSSSRSAPDLVGAMWAGFRETYEEAGNLGRQTLLGWLRRVAPYQPQRVVGLAEWTLANPALDGARDDIRVDKHSAVVWMLPSLLEECAYGPELERVCELLWRMGRDDDREPGRFPDHPIRVLSRIAEYGPTKSLGVCERVAAIASKWLDDPAVASYAHSPFEILGGFLAKAGLDQIPATNAVRFNHFTVNPNTTRPLREQVVSTAVEHASSAHPRVALAAVKLLSDALADPIGFFGRVVTAEEKARWESEQVAMLRGLRAVVSRRSDPVVHLKIHSAVRWFERRGQSAAVREAARHVREAIRATFEFELTAALHSPWAWAWDEDTDDWLDVKKAEQRRVERMLAVRDSVLATWTEPVAVLENLGIQVAAIAVAGEQPEPGYLFDMLCEADENLARVAATYLVEHRHHPLAPFLGLPLRRLREKDEGAAIELADWAWEHGDDVTRHAVAALYGRAAWTQSVTAAEHSLLMKVIAARLPRSDSGASGVKILAGDDPEKAKGLVLAFAPSDRYQAEAVAEILEPDGVLFSALSDQELAAVVAKFVEPSDLEGTPTQTFLAGAAARIPLAVVALLLARIEAAAARSPTRYQPVPFPDSSTDWWSGLGSTPRRATLVRIAEAALLPLTPARAVHVPKLFAWVAGDWGDDVRAMIGEWIESGDAERVRVALEMITGAPAAIVYEQTAFVDRILMAAVASGAEPAALRAFRIAVYNAGSGRRLFASPDHDRQVREKAAEAASKQAHGSPRQRLYHHIEQHAAELEERTRRADDHLGDGWDA